jgi:hypothetical protein
MTVDPTTNHQPPTTGMDDGHVALLAPVAVERLPLYRWRPGTRLLAVGSRDGASFAGDPEAAERNTFRRPFDAALLTSLRTKLDCAGYAVMWSDPLRHPRGLATVLEAAGEAPVVVCTPGRGAVTAELLARVDAWVLLADAQPGPAVAEILAGGRHVEVLAGLDGRPLPALEWARAAAMHLVARRPAEADQLDGWCAVVRGAWTARVPLHDHHHQHSDCACGERLVWRHNGRSRLDGLVDGRCQRCGATAPGVWR